MTDELHKLGEVLRTAREAKGVDLTRVERDTKIRSRYLSALERGDYRELPGAVYTRGFLRNYGLYLGLDPEYLIDLYRLESGAAPVERPTPAAPPRPIATRRSRALVVTPGAVAATILTVAVAAFIVWLGWEFYNFARTPDLQIVEPAGDITGYAGTSYLIRGRTVPNAKVKVDGARENPTVTADAGGDFSVSVELVPGSNVVTFQADDPVTHRPSAVVTRTITVIGAEASSTPAPALALEEPAADATLASPVSVAGTSAPDAAVTVNAKPVAAATPPFSVTDEDGEPVAIRPAAPAPPPPMTLTAESAGAFSGEVALAPGVWELSASADGGNPVTRRVTVTPPSGLSGALVIEGGSSYLEVDQDGAPVAGISGGISNDGDRVALQAQRSLRIRAGNAAAVHVTLNGLEIGAMGASGAVVEWNITRTGG